MSTLRDIAAAKLNLALHVRGKRPDGRHDIETIFAFCTDGDRLSVEPADVLSLTATGPFAAELPPEQDNVILKAARRLAEVVGVEQGAAITLDSGSLMRQERQSACAPLHMPELELQIASRHQSRHRSGGVDHRFVERPRVDCA